MSRMNVPSYGVSTASHTSYVSIRKDMWPQGRLAMRKTSLIVFSNFPQFLTHIFLSCCIIFIAANDIFPKRLLLPIYISVALARRFFLEKQTSGSWRVLLPVSSSPSAHWEMLKSLLCALAGGAGKETPANLSLLLW